MTPALNPAPQPTSCVTLGGQPDFSEPLFPALQDGVWGRSNCEDCAVVASVVTATPAGNA